MSAEQSELGVREGDILMPNLTTSMHTMAVTTVAKWATTSTQYERAIGDILLRAQGTAAVMVTPTIATIQRVQHTASLWTTGVRIFSATHAWPRSAAHVDAVRHCAREIEDSG